MAAGGLVPGDLAVDVGGGPGHHAAVWAGDGLRAVVVDPGREMNRIAAARPGVQVVRARGEAIPLRTGLARLVLFHLSIHYGDWRLSLAEAARVLARGGVCRVWTLGPDHHEVSLLARWFPSVAAIDRVRFPDPSDLAAELARYGTVSSGTETETKERRVGEWIAAVRAGFVSTLQMVDRGEIDRGLAAFCAAHPDPGERVSYELRWTWIAARV
jgi:SAM-dependent methyltransferase